MISNDRARERPPFLRDAPLRDLGDAPYLYPTFRQALLDYLSQIPRGAVLMPDYVPQGVHDPYRRAGWEIAFYPVAASLALDREAIARALDARRPDHVVLIHHFGVYIEENVRLARELLPAGTALLEDFAHSLPQDDVPVRGDLAAYSSTKMLGVAEGARLVLRGEARAAPCRYAPEDAASRALRSRLERRLAFESFFAARDLPRVADSAMRRLLRRRAEYYGYVQENYSEIRARIGSRSRTMLERIDLVRVAERRRKIARLYVEGLDPRLLLPVPRESLIRQALYAFPILVADRTAFMAGMRRRGVRASALVDHWWFQAEEPGHELRDRHVLLPANHYLSDVKVRRVIEAANEAARSPHVSRGA